MKQNDVFDKMIANKQTKINLDPWILHQADQFNALKNVIGIVEYKGYRFNISKKSGGGIGMGEYPPETEVTILFSFPEGV